MRARAAATNRTRASIESVAESATNPAELFGEVAGILRGAMPLDGWCGHTLDPATALPTGGDAREGFRPDLLPRLLEIEYLVGDVNPFDGLLRRTEPVGVLHDATQGRPERSPRYREIVTVSGFEHEMRSVFRHQGRPWGALVLLRAADAPGFTSEEADLMSAVSSTLAEAVKRLLLRGHVEAGGLPRRAGLLILDGGSHVETMTPEAERWLTGLREHDGELPLTVVALACRAAEANGAAVRARARDSAGAWVNLMAWSLGERVAVSMEACAPHDMTALALEAYPLSDRERQVVELVLLGCSTAEIAKRLFLSPYTVQDHLKAVFGKTGVRSRRELVADLFFRHYLPRIERGTQLSAEGTFVADP